MLSVAATTTTTTTKTPEIQRPGPPGGGSSNNNEERPSSSLRHDAVVNNKKAATTTLLQSGRTTTKRTSRRPEPSLTATICNAFDDIINNFIDPPLRSSVDPKNVLSHNFAPVDELPPTDCPVVEGELPDCLDGAYIRNGPNPQHLPRGPYHLFDGDGMLHSLRVSGGRATLCSRYVRTYKYNLEREAGAPVIPSVFSGFNTLAGAATRGAVTAARVLSGQYDPREGVGVANTSLVFFGGRLYALWEADLPYALRVTPEGDIETLGRCDFGGRLSMGMTAHPKVDPETGEVFAFRYGPVPPFVTLFRFGSDGSRKGPDVPIFSMTQPSLLHDFAVTRRYALVPDIQLGMRPADMVVGAGPPVGSDPSKIPRIGVIPRYATSESEMRWFEVPGFNAMHTINAWDEEDGDAVVLVAPNVLSIGHALERIELVHCAVERVRIDMRTGVVTRTPISARNLDFGVINPGRVGRRSRYAYMGLGDPMPRIAGVVKLDLVEGCEVGFRRYGPGCFGGEPFFVPKSSSSRSGDMDVEDDGYVVSYVHDEGRDESRFVVMDAKSPTLDIVASVRLPQRVPYGFHGLFVGQHDLNKQTTHSKHK